MAYLNGTRSENAKVDPSPNAAMLRPSDFLGSWQIARQIDDALSGTQASFDGIATIEAGAQSWRYVEKGKLALVGAKPMTAERQYIWQADESGIDIHFDDGRFFHRLILGGASPEAPTAQHWCDPDQYNVTYDFSKWPCWTSVWQVEGPRKNYVMTSVFNPRTPETEP